MAGGVDEEGHRYHFIVFGFPVHVGWQFFIWPVLAGLDWRTPTQLVEWVAVVFASVMIHEIGHAVAYRRYGSPARISLWGLGGLTYGRQPRYRWQDLIISLAGPIPPLIFVGIPAYLAWKGGVAETNPFWHQTLIDIWYANLFWSLVNLVPLLPLDGGRAVDTWFGRRVARIASIVFGSIATVALFVVWQNTSLALLALILTGMNIYIFTKERPLNLAEVSGYMETPGGMRYGGPPPDHEPKQRGKRSLSLPGKRKKSKAKLKSVPTGPDPREPEAWAALEAGNVGKADKVVKKLGSAASPVAVGAVLARQGNATAAVAAYATGMLAGYPVPPVGEQILAEAGIARPVAEWIAESDQIDRVGILSQLLRDLMAAGYGDAAAQVSDVLSSLDR